MRWIRVLGAALPGLLLAGFATMHPPGLGPETAHHWWTMHVLLIPVFPLLPLALLALPRGTGAGADRVGRVLAGLAAVAGYGFATCYTALDVLAGIGAGLVVEHEGRAGGTELRLFAVADPIGLAGVWLLLACAVLVTVLLGRRYGPRVIPGGLVLVGAGWVFRTSHIFHPVGTLAMLGLAAGTAMLALAAPVPGRGERGSVVPADT